jgi:hypothetical protein
MNLDDSNLMIIFNDLTELLQSFRECMIECKKDDSSVVGDGTDVRAEAFNILLVLTNRRDAMLIQSFEGYNPDADKMKCLEEKINSIMLEKYDKLKLLIQNKYKFDSIDLLFQDDNIWIYNRSIQKEVDLKKETHHITDILRYECKFPSREVAFRAAYKCNDTVFIGISGAKINFDHIKYLYNCLEKYKQLADRLNQKVILNIEFR